VSSEIETTLRPQGHLIAAETAMRRVIDELAVSKSEVDPTTLDLLTRLRLAPGQALRGVDLCGQLLKSPSHVSRLIDRAESRGLVHRQPDPNDRRAQLITLTEAGVVAIDAFFPHVVEVLNETWFAALSADEVDKLVDLLSRVTASARDLLEDAARGWGTSRPRL